MNDSDPDGDPLSLVLTPLAGPSQGVVTLNVDGIFTYVPNANFSGADAFTYQISDGNGGFDQATVMITVDPVNDAPTARADTYNVAEDDVLTIPAGSGLLSNDSDIEGDVLTVSAAPLTEPWSGLLILNSDGTFTYTPDTDFNGTDGFSYELTDSSGAVSQATVTITVDPVNDAPVGVADRVSTPADGRVAMSFGALTGNDTDIDGDALTLTSFSQPGQGVVVDNGDGSLTYIPNANFSGVDSFTYTMTDPGGAQSTALVVVDVTASGSIVPDDPAEPISVTKPVFENGIPPNGFELVGGGDLPAPGAELEDVQLDVPLLGSGSRAADSRDGGVPMLPIADNSDDSRAQSTELPSKYFHDIKQVLGRAMQVPDPDAEFGELGVNVDLELLSQALDTVERQMRGQENRDLLQSVSVMQIAAGAAVTLSGAYAAWILRDGALGSMMGSSMPLWNLG